MGHHSHAAPIINVIMPPVVDSPQPSYVVKAYNFCTHPTTVKYMGRTVFVIALAALIYYGYRNRKRIKNCCDKCVTAWRTNPMLTTPPSTPKLNKTVHTFKLDVNQPININVNVNKDLEEGKNSTLEGAKEPVVDPAVKV